MARDGHACQLRLSGCQVRATDVHHLGDGDDHDLSNLAAACSRCHRSVSGRQAGSAPHER